MGRVRAGTDDGGLFDSVPFLARLEPDERTALLALGHEMVFERRQALLREAEPSSHVLVIVSGWTKVTTYTLKGYEVLLALRGAGDLVGEHSVLTGRSRSATVTALEDVRALAVEAKGFRDFLHDSPRISLVLGGLVSDRNRAGDLHRVRSASMDVRERLAAFLLDLTHVHSRSTPAGIEIGIPLSKDELAGSVGASREAVQRELKKLRDKGVVRTARRALVIIRPDVLRRIAGGAPGTGPGDGPDTGGSRGHS